MGINFKTRSEGIHSVAQEMDLDNKVSGFKVTSTEEKQSCNEPHSICAELGVVTDSKDLASVESQKLHYDPNLSADSPEEFLCEILKHYIKKNRYEEIIRFVADSVHRSIDLNEVIENALDAMNKHIETAENVSIYMVEGKDAVLKSYRGYPKELIQPLDRIPSPRGFTWKTINSGKPLYCPDVDKDTYIGLKGRRLGTKSYVSMPISYLGKAIGCININSIKKFAFDREELNLLEIVASQIETAINNAKQAQALKVSEEALKKAHNDLEERVQDRTSELQKSNNLLIKEILERRYMEKELKQSLVEKNVLLKEIHHRVKNNLQIISSLLNLQSRQLKDKSVLNIFNESHNRIRSIATLHEQLYRSKDLSRINFTAYLTNMTKNLLRSYGVGDDLIRIYINSKYIFLDINTAIPCGLIVNELVSNAVKHGFADDRCGEITIDFNLHGNKYVLIVSNNGIEFPKDLDINNCTTLGLDLVSSLSKQLNGSISLTTDGVTRFELEFSS